ncbi:probable ubiquitin carboxyl-terminal hydrolase MINDY-4 isoform X2 [Argiope bruennichi]|nr:probable ubiquitin carboxyl-terminal hydrolase MINDY-4 isoform X2 [Argiope bruennichi]
MDCTDSHLIGTDGYCSQEVVNLMLTGKAVPNLFDGVVELNSGGSETTILRGIPGQSKIGLLSLYEYQGNCTVGNYYKNPVYPIWIMLADSHFTVLFALSRSILRNKKKQDPFTLYHYNGLAKRHAETSYIINPAGNSSPPPNDRTLPAVICCIHTRWPNASVDPNIQVNENSAETNEEDTNE